ncbi:MAG: hypothetical protein MUO85_03310 [candidate division Zixibacteria bacterium]|nr:hypothetical protein [candidate division Zixibacteria bacterium]
MLNSISQNQVTNVVTGSSDKTNSQTTLDKDEFLQLLITQLQNQDPTSPMTNQDFIAQLAQFSSLEQLQNMNDQLETSTQWDYLLSQTINNTMAASVIGKSIKATTDEVYLSESDSPKINFEIENSAAKVEIEISDKDGNLIRTIEKTDVAEGEGEVEWDGKNDMGNRVASGTYTVSIKAYDSDGNSVAANTLLKGKVSGVKYIEGSAYLMVEGLDVPLSDVVQIFQEE